MKMKTDTRTSKLCSLLQAHGGLFHAAPAAYVDKDEIRFSIRTAQAGDVSMLWPEIARRSRSVQTIHGTGSGLGVDEALIPALAEGLERYSTAVFRKEQFVWAAAAELGNDALDLDTVPRCSRAELAHPRCPLTVADKSIPIRWVRGLSLLDRRVMYVPAIMVYSHIGVTGGGERFWLPISTGCAAHISSAKALLRAICEIIERDAISIVWLQKLPLPEIEVDCCSPHLEPYWKRYLEGPEDVQYHFYNATSDLGVPTVYCLQIAPYNKRKTTLVACCTAISYDLAITKAMADMVSLGLAFRRSRAIPDNWDDYTDVMHGSIYMARAEQASAFEFLLAGKQKQKLSELPGGHNEIDEADALTRVLATLDRRQFATYVVDLSTDEAIRADMRVVRVIVPGLQPVSFRYRARYLGHPRLYDAPARMGYPVLQEQELNPWPQPFA